MTLFREIAHAVRSLRRTTGFTFMAVIILATGIGANVVVFSVINAAMLRPLLYPHPERLAVISWYSSQKLISEDISAAAFLAMEERARSFESIAAIHSVDAGVNIRAQGAPQYLKALRVSGGFFHTLAAFPAAGRAFDAEEERTGGAKVAVISNDLAVREYGGNRSALGRDLRVNGELFTIIGVMPAGFRSYPEADIWLPLQLSLADADPGNEYRVIARLHDGSTYEEAQRELDSTEEYRLTFPLKAKSREVRLVLQGLQSFIASDIKRSLRLLFEAVIFVLLITCTNLAVLVTLRASLRTREVAIRLALGSSRGRLIRMFFIESLILAMMGGTLGLILAKEAIPFVLLRAPAHLQVNGSVGIDGMVVLFAFVISVLTALIFGLVPALKMLRANLNELLRQTSGNYTSGKQQSRAGWLLISVESALTFTLLVGTGLLLNSFLRLQSVSPGFDPRNVWIAQISLASERYNTTSASSQLLNQVCERLKHLPGIESAAGIQGLPMEHGLNLVLHPTDDPQKIVYAEYRVVSAEYFHALQIAMVRGRPFSAADSAHSTPVAIVNETLGKKWWPSGDMLGRYSSVNSTMGGLFADPERRIVGVVADVREYGLASPPPPTIFVPADQIPDSITAFVNRTFLTSIVIRTAGGASPSDYVLSGLASADPDLPVASVRPLSEVIATSIAQRRFYTSLISAFGLFALALTAIGLYGVLSYQIMLRTREIGVRLAVGARRAAVTGMIVRQGLKLVVAGILAGLAAVPLENRILASMLYNVRGTDFTVLAEAALTLAVVAILASLFSAIRAASIEPVVALSFE